MARSADYRVEIVDSSAVADVSVFVVNGEVVDLTGAADGDVITVQADGSLAAEPPVGGGGLASVIDDPRYRMAVTV